MRLDADTLLQRRRVQARTIDRSPSPPGAGVQKEDFRGDDAGNFAAEICTRGIFEGRKIRVNAETQSGWNKAAQY